MGRPSLLRFLAFGGRRLAAAPASCCAACGFYQPEQHAPRDSTWPWDQQQFLYSTERNLRGFSSQTASTSAEPPRPSGASGQRKGRAGSRLAARDELESELQEMLADQLQAIEERMAEKALLQRRQRETEEATAQLREGLRQERLAAKQEAGERSEARKRKKLEQNLRKAEAALMISEDRVGSASGTGDIEAAEEETVRAVAQVGEAFAALQALAQPTAEDSGDAPEGEETSAAEADDSQAGITEMTYKEMEQAAFRLFMQQGLDHQGAVFLLRHFKRSRNPRISLDPERLRAHFTAIKAALPSGVSMRQLLRQNAGVFLARAEALRKTLGFVDRLIPGRDLPEILRAAPRIASTTQEQVKSNIQELTMLLPSADVCALVAKCPVLMAVEGKRLRESIETIETILDGQGAEAAVLSMPYLAGTSPRTLRGRWQTISTAIEHRDLWRQEVEQIRSDPRVVAYLLSRRGSVLERLTFLAETMSGEDLSLADVIGMEDEIFGWRFDRYFAWQSARKEERQREGARMRLEGGREQQRQQAEVADTSNPLSQALCTGEPDSGDPKQSLDALEA